jgi:hypothetical protein
MAKQSNTLEMMLPISRRDNTLLTVGFSLRYRNDIRILVPHGTAHKVRMAYQEMYNRLNIISAQCVCLIKESIIQNKLFEKI